MIIDVIVAFCGAKCLREIGTRVPVTVDVFLQQNTTGGMLGGVSRNSEESREIRKL